MPETCQNVQFQLILPIKFYGEVMNRAVFKLINIVLWTLSCFSLFAQSNTDRPIRDLFGSIVHLTENIPKLHKHNRKSYYVVYREPKTDSIIEVKNPMVGSGFFLKREVDRYLITADHVARHLNGKSKICYRGPLSGQKLEFKLSDLTRDRSDTLNLNWIRHPKADIALLYLGVWSDEFEDKEIRSISYESLVDTLQAPNRLCDVTIFGFPKGLGNNKGSISPITKRLRPASDIVYLERFDNGIKSPFILLDNPSVGGFSGGPAIVINEPFRESDNQTQENPKKELDMIGLIHGTIAGPGGFSAVVPAKQIIDLLDRAPKFSGQYTFHYPNGELWSERIYKDGLPWTVLSNFKTNGEPQKMGSLKNGNGTLYIYNSREELEQIRVFKNGKKVETIMYTKG